MPHKKLVILALITTCLILSGAILFLFKMDSQYRYVGDKESGYLYSKAAMKYLSHKVDSVHHALRTQPKTKTYYSRPQAYAHIVKLKAQNLSKPERDLKNGIGFEVFIDRYPTAEVFHDQLLVGTRPIAPEEDPPPLWSYSLHSVSLEKWSTQTERNCIDLAPYSSDLKNTSRYDIRNHYYDSLPELVAFFFTSDLDSQPLPPVAANMVRYTDALIDSSQTIFPEERELGWFFLQDGYQNLPKAQQALLLDSARNIQLDIFCGTYNPSEGIYTRDIAILAAETGNWDLFLRAHLQILNEETYNSTQDYFGVEVQYSHVRELEALGIEVHELMLGCWLAVQNPAPNRVFLYLNQLGVGLTEMQDRDQIEWQLLNLVTNESLDVYNRVLVLQIFFQYNDALVLTDPQRAAINQEKLANAVKSLPEELASQVRINEE